MDYLSLAVGFVVGGFTGAAGAFYGDKFTDQRRAREARNAKREEWEGLCKRFPAVIAEMREDVMNPEFFHVREFFVREPGDVINNLTPALVYDSYKHRDIAAAIESLSEMGYIDDISKGESVMYRMRLAFVDRLRELEPTR